MKNLITAAVLTKSVSDILDLSNCSNEQLFELSMSQDGVLQTATAGKVDAILLSENPTETMAELFSVYRLPYASAKEKGLKVEAQKIAKAWSRLSNTMHGHFSRSEMSASWPTISTGSGSCSLITKQEQTKKKNAEALLRKEKQSIDAAKNEQQQATEQAQQLRSLTVDQLVSMIESTVKDSGNDIYSVIKALAVKNDMSVSKKRTSKRAIAKKA